MSGFDDDRRRGRKTFGEVLDHHLDRPGEPVDPIHVDGESLATALGDRGIAASDAGREPRPGLADGQLVLVPVAPEAPHVGHPHQVVSVVGCHEGDSRVATQLASSVVVVGEVQREDRQSVVRQAAAGPVGFDDVDPGVERVGGGAGVEVAVPLAVDGVELHPRIGALRHAVVLDHLATHVDELVESHFFPVLEPGLVAA